MLRVNEVEKGVVAVHDETKKRVVVENHQMQMKFDRYWEPAVSYYLEEEKQKWGKQIFVRPMTEFMHKFSMPEQEQDQE